MINNVEEGVQTYREYLRELARSNNMPRAVRHDSLLGRIVRDCRTIQEVLSLTHEEVRREVKNVIVDPKIALFVEELLLKE